MARNVYLGQGCMSPPCVDDRGRPGLDRISEVRDIADRIIEDCEAGRISYRTAMARMNLLELVVSRDSSFTVEQRLKARRLIDRKREELMEKCGG